MQNSASARLSRNISPEEYDLVILGSGAGGKLAAWTYSKQGHRVAVIERKYIGGSCPNIACLPSKNIIHSAKIATYFGRANEFGITGKGFAIEMSGVRDRKRRMVSGLVDAHLKNYKVAAQNSSSALAGSSVRRLWRPHYPTEPHVNCAGPM